MHKCYQSKTVQATSCSLLLAAKLSSYKIKECKQNPVNNNIHNPKTDKGARDLPFSSSSKLSGFKSLEKKVRSKIGQCVKAEE